MAEAKYFYIFHQENECNFEAYFTNEKALTNFVADYLRDFAKEAENGNFYELEYKIYRIPIEETFNCEYATWKSSPERNEIHFL